MLIECPTCSAIVEFELIAESQQFQESEEYIKYQLLTCKKCKNVIFGVSTLYQDIFDNFSWSNPTRLWPNPAKDFNHNVPLSVWRSLEEAEKCFKANAYMACAVMCGRVIEAVCKEKTGEMTIQKGLIKLKSTNQIDDQLYNWGEALRKERNIGAHANEEMISKYEARHILDFSHAIVD